MRIDNSLGSGVYFEPSAYPGITRRLLAMLTDCFVILLAAVAIWVPVLFVTWDQQPALSEAIFLLLWIGFIWCYMTVVKRSSFRTIGYRIFGIRIVTTEGKRPTLTTMTFRFGMWIFGPFSLLMDVIWVGPDSEHQTLRDCYASTYVIRADAQPAGTGPVYLTRYFAAGLALAYPRVVHQDTAKG